MEHSKSNIFSFQPLPVLSGKQIAARAAEEEIAEDESNDDVNEDGPITCKASVPGIDG